MINSVKSFLEIDENTTRTFTVVHILKNCVNNDNLKLTLKKCKFGLDQVPYVGHLFKKEGLKPDEAKVKAIKEIPPPDSPEALHRFLGMINYKNSLTWAILVSIRIKRRQRLQPFA